MYTYGIPMPAAKQPAKSAAKQPAKSAEKQHAKSDAKRERAMVNQGLRENTVRA